MANTQLTIIRYTASATKVYELRADLTDIPQERLVIKHKRRRSRPWKVKSSYYVCRYDVQLTVGPSGDLRFAIKYDGQTLPSSGAPEKVNIQVSRRPIQRFSTYGIFLNMT